MFESPTLILLAESACEPFDSLLPNHRPASTEAASEWLHPLQCTIHKARQADLQVRLIAPPALHHQVRHLLAPEHIMALEASDPTSAAEHQGLAQSIARAVLSSAQSDGWLLLTCDMPLLQSSTLKTLSQALQVHPVVYPTYRCRRGHPVGFSSEFYSTLSRLRHDRDLQRLMTQYPAHGIPINDAGVLMAQANAPQLAQLRNLLQGPLACDAPL